MAVKNFSTATGKILGLNQEPYYFDHHCYWASSITFDDISDLCVKNMSVIRMGDTLEEAKEFWDNIKENFKKAGINNRDKVDIIFNIKTGEPVALGNEATKLWIDVEDKFTLKSYRGLKALRYKYI